MRGSGNTDFLAEIDILNGVQKFDAFLHGALEGFASGDEACTARAFVDDGREGRVRKVVLAAGASRVDQTGAAHIAIGDLVAAEVDGVVGGEFRIDALVELAVTGVAGIQCREAAVVFREFLFDDIGLDRATEVVGLAGEVRRDMVIFVFFEGGVAQVAPQNGGHAQIVGQGKRFGNLSDLPRGILTAKINRRTHGRRPHIVRGLHLAEQNLLKFVRIRQQFVVVEFDKERDFVSVFAGDGTKDAKCGSNRIAATFHRKTHDVFRIEVDGVFGETGTRRVFHALVHRKDREIAGTGESPGIGHAVEVVDHALISVAGGEDSVHKIRSGQVEEVFGDGLARMAEEGVGLVSEERGDGIDHIFGSE
jgi:hypothetical protein